MNLWDAVAGAKVYDLAQPMKKGMPQSPNHPPFRMLLERRHGDHVRPDGGSASNEIIVTGGHVGTHIDALAHVSQDGKVYGGLVAAELQSDAGFSKLGIDSFPPYVGRGVLLDVTAVHGVATLEPGYEVTVEDLEKAQEKANVEIRPGDAVLVGTGWSRRWAERDAFIGMTDGVPGVGEAAGKWLAKHKISIAGGETIAYEVIRPGKGHSELPVHRVMLVDNGINIMETMRLFELLDANISEFLFVVAPLMVVGATGSPVRPLAIVK